MICFIRVDNRLIHGQVVQAWLPKIKPDKVLVISKQATQNTLMAKMMRMALPQGYELEVLSAEDALESLKKDEAKKVFILVEDLNQLAELAKLNIVLEKVNIGNTKYEEGKKEFSTGVYFDKQDLAIITELKKQNINFSIKALPSSLEAKINA